MISWIRWSGWRQVVVMVELDSEMLRDHQSLEDKRSEPDPYFVCSLISVNNFRAFRTTV